MRAQTKGVRMERRKWETGIIRRDTWDTRSVGFGGSEVLKEGDHKVTPHGLGDEGTAGPVQPGQLQEPRQVCVQ